MPNKRILFISRKFPPSIGGMQMYSKHLLEYLQKYYQVDAIVLGKSQVHLLWFLPFVICKALILGVRYRYDIVYCTDSLLAPLRIVLRAFFRRWRWCVTAHGLDVTFNNWVYQWIIRNTIKDFDRIICVSAYTQSLLIKRGIDRERCEVIHNGYVPIGNSCTLHSQEIKSRINDLIGIDVADKKLILSVGRLVRRKGVQWFIEDVFSKLTDEYIFVVCGQGELFSSLKVLVQELRLEKKVFLLGTVSDNDLALLYSEAYVFVMPNQKVADNPEGFGIVALEAARLGVAVLAHDIEGITDAVINGKTGWLIEYNRADKFIEKIKNPQLSRNEIINANKVYSWDEIILRYRQLFDALLQKGQ